MYIMLLNVFLTKLLKILEIHRKKSDSSTRCSSRAQMSESQDLVLYHALLSSFSQKVVLALESLNLGYESRFVNLGIGEQLEPWYLDLNPKGEVPTLKDGDVVLTDSADIIQYLNDTYDTRSKFYSGKTGINSHGVQPQ